MKPRAARAIGFAILAGLAGCGVQDCLPPPESPDRQALRNDLVGRLYSIPCPGRHDPSSLRARAEALRQREGEFLGRVERSRFRPDLERARQEAEQMSRTIMVDCVFYPPEQAEEPENVKAVTAEIEAGERQLAEAMRRFEALDRACPAV